MTEKNREREETVTINRNLARATKMAPIVERVHGANHPELTRVREITEELREADGARVPGLFAELSAVTGDYTIPGDVCEGFEATYTALRRADGELTRSA